MRDSNNGCVASAKIRSSRGISLAEFAVALVVGLPLLIAILFTALECSTYFTIKTKLDVSARTAARQLAIAFGSDPTVADNPTKTNPRIAAILTAAKIPSVVNDINQFNDPQFVPGAPGTVTIVVRYPIDGQFGLQKFPNPDPLQLGSKIQPVSMATFALE